jgi:hypothetical protein
MHSKFTKIIALGIGLIMPMCANAAVTDKDLMVAVKTFNFIEDLAPGNVDLAIIYDPANGSSKADAENVKGLFGALNAGKFKLNPVLVEVGGLSAINARVAYISEGLDGKFDDIFSATSSKKIMSFSANNACVIANKCVMSASATPVITISLSKAATESSGIKFAQALRLMVKEN